MTDPADWEWSALLFRRAVDRYGGKQIFGFGHDRARFEITFEGVRLELVYNAVDRSGAETTLNLGVWVETVVPGTIGFTVEVEQGLVARFLRLFRRVELEGMDGFVVSADDDAFVRLWFDDEVCASYARAAPAFMRLDAGLMRMRMPQKSTGSELWLQAAASIARRGTVVAGSLRELAVELGATVTGDVWCPQELVLSMERGLGRVELDYVVSVPGESWRARGLRTRLRCGRSTPGAGELRVYHRDTRRGRRPKRGGLEAVRLDDAEWVAFSDQPLEASARLRSLTPTLETARPESLVVDESMVTAMLDGVPLELERLRAAVELAFALAHGADSGPGGPYRSLR